MKLLTAAANIGKKVRINKEGDTWMVAEWRPFIGDRPDGLTIDKITRGGKVHCRSDKGRFLTICARHLTLV